MGYKKESIFSALINEESVEEKIFTNNEIPCKFVGKNHPQIPFKSKGGAFYIKSENTWYFRLADTENYYRVKWYNIDASFEIGFYGKATYKGINPNLKDALGDLTVTKDFDWFFNYQDEKYKLVNPDSVELI